MRNSPEDRDRWTEQRKTIVTTMWNAGETSTHIADTFGVSRSAILGLIHRMGLSNRRVVTPRAARKPKATTKFNFATNASKAAPKPVEREPYVYRETVVTPAEQRLSFDDIVDGRCKYAHGDTPPYSFCGAKSAALGGSWCETHMHAVFGTKPVGEVFTDTSKNPEPQLYEKIGQLEAVE